jgi:hypothetical protein
MLDLWLNESFAHIQNQIWKQSEAQLRMAAPEISKVASLSEQTLQDEIGNINEIAFAAARLLNEIPRFLATQLQPGMGRRKREGLRNGLADLILIAHRWNGSNYAIDKVSYGEWIVKAATPRGCTFDILDQRLELSRAIGIRREHSQWLLRMRGSSAPRTQIAERLRDYIPDFLDSTLGYFGEKVGLNVTTVSYWQIRQELEQRLATLGAEDDLLLIAAGPESGVSSDYIAAVCVQWFQQITAFAASKRKIRNFETCRIPVKVLLSFLPFEST